MRLRAEVIKKMMGVLMIIARNCLVLAFLTAATAAQAGECRYLQSGVASVYSEKFDGRKTASGEKLNMSAHTAAHKTLKDGTRLKVVDTKTNRSTYVRVNDNGPYAKNRVIDLTRAPAAELGFAHGRHGLTGLRRVKIYVCN
jgi:rare lipoprotein A (peptidoglycan hydrolase)